MTQLNEDHFELHSSNKDKRYPEQKIKYLEDRMKTLEKSIERIHKIMARFQMTEGVRLTNKEWLEKGDK